MGDLALIPQAQTMLLAAFVVISGVISANLLAGFSMRLYRVIVNTFTSARVD